MAYSIMMDAGHGGRDPGAVYNGRQEKDDTLRLALAVGENLQNNGIDVEYTRTTDVYETPYEKAMAEKRQKSPPQPQGWNNFFLADRPIFLLSQFQ